MKTFFPIVILFAAMMLVGSCQEEVVVDGDDIYHSWEATTFVSVESVAYAKNENSPIVLTFKRDGTYELKLDMNSCMGTFEKGEGDSIQISYPGCTKICCDSKFSEKLAGTLSKVSSYSIEENVLQLKVEGWGFVELELVEED